jgi:hypothetical protein
MILNLKIKLNKSHLLILLLPPEVYNYLTSNVKFDLPALANGGREEGATTVKPTGAAHCEHWQQGEEAEAETETTMSRHVHPRQSRRHTEKRSPPCCISVM